MPQPNTVMSTVYLETSIISYLRQKPSSQVVTAARQMLTHRWWDNERSRFELVVSQYVIDEVSAGDQTLAADRLQTLESIPVLPNAPEILRIANEIMSRAILPPKARGRIAYRLRRPSSDRIPTDMELQAHCECEDTAPHSSCSVRNGHSDPGHLHP